MKIKRIDRISNTMLKRHCVFTENSTIFFTNAELPEFGFDKIVF